MDGKHPIRLHQLPIGGFRQVDSLNGVHALMKLIGDFFSAVSYFYEGLLHVVVMSFQNFFDFMERNKRQILPRSGDGLRFLLPLVRYLVALLGLLLFMVLELVLVIFVVEGVIHHNSCFIFVVFLVCSSLRNRILVGGYLSIEAGGPESHLTVDPVLSAAQDIVFSPNTEIFPNFLLIKMLDET